MGSSVVKITKKGQATIPISLRKKFGFKDKAIVVESEKGILFKPFPAISKEKGSLRELFIGTTVEEVMRDAREIEEMLR